jgi:hypothetical protein
MNEQTLTDDLRKLELEAFEIEDLPELELNAPDATDGKALAMCACVFSCVVAPPATAG